MKSISLNEYTDTKQYFLMLDVLIKNVASNKEAFLEEHYISPSSYRRAKNDGNKIGEQILKDLSPVFNYKLVDNEFINELEERINKIYFNIYYKIYGTYQDDINYVEDLISMNLIIYPVLKLIKLLMLLNQFNAPKDILETNKLLFEEVKSFYHFYNDDLKELFEIVDVSFSNDNNALFLSKEYKNELTYYTLSTKCYLDEKYIEAIYFASIAKNKFVENENFKRIYYVNLTLMSTFNVLEKYQQCYELSKKQMLSLNSIDNIGFEYIGARKHYIISCLGLKKYKEIIKELKDVSSIKYNEVICLLIAYYYESKNNYEEYFDKVIEKLNFKIEKKNLIYRLDTFLKKKDKNFLNYVNDTVLPTALLNILKKM